MNWIDAETKRPKDGQKIILENYLGLYWATYHNLKDGIVYIEAKSKDWEQWDKVDRWIPYPEDAPNYLKGDYGKAKSALQIEPVKTK